MAYAAVALLLASCQTLSPIGFSLTVTPPSDGLVSGYVRVQATATHVPFADANYTWHYDLGDGTTGSSTRSAHQFTTQHRYDEAGTYMVTVTLTGQGKSVTHSEEVTLQPVPRQPAGTLGIEVSPREAVTESWNVWVRSWDLDYGEMVYCHSDTNREAATCAEQFDALSFSLAPGEYDVTVTARTESDDAPDWVPTRPSENTISVSSGWTETVTITDLGHHTVSASFRPARTATYSHFNVNAYDQARVYVFGLASTEAFEAREVTARCYQSDFPDLHTNVAATSVPVSSEPSTATLRFTSGWHYFVDGPITYCAFDLFDEHGWPAHLVKTEE